MGIINPAASAITYIPTGDIAAVNVQDAVDELDNDKISKIVSVPNFLPLFNDVDSGLDNSIISQDVVNDRIGINISTPLGMLHLANNSGNGELYLQGNSQGTDHVWRFRISGNTGNFSLADIGGSGGIFRIDIGSNSNLMHLSLNFVEVRGQLSVFDEPYNSIAWNNNLEVPTKNAIRDALENLDPGGGFSGALISNSVSQAMPGGADTPLVWDTESYDDGGWFDSATNNSDFIVPDDGTTRIRVTLNVSSLALAGQLFGRVFLNDIEVIGLPRSDTDTAGGENVNMISAPIIVVAGDRLTALAFGSDAWGTAPLSTWFAIEAI